MRIFVSWSGTESKLVAELLRDWLPHVVQSADLYVSSQDIEKGERWAVSVTSNLSELDFGIIVVTPSNIDAPWVNFEAGALSKSVKSRVIPLLCGMDRIDAAGSPLQQFQYALANRDDIFRMVASVNDACVRPLEAARFETAFSKWWPDFEASFAKLEFASAAQGPKTQSDTQLGKIEAALESIMSDMARMRRSLPSARLPTTGAGTISIPSFPEWVEDRLMKSENPSPLEQALLAQARQAAREQSRAREVKRRGRPREESDSDE